MGWTTRFAQFALADLRRQKDQVEASLKELGVGLSMLPKMKAAESAGESPIPMSNTILQHWRALVPCLFVGD